MRPYFLRLSNRWQHLWLAGSGPPLLLLHGTPGRALRLRPLIERLAQDFMVIAPDTPGNGYSDPLPPQATKAEHYVTAQLELLDALRVGAFSVYGTQSGATLAAELALRVPERVRSLVTDGLALWTEAEVEQLGEPYLPETTAAADGSHLTTIWNRVLDQNLFFPWHDRRRARALRQDLTNCDQLQRQAMDFLDAGPSYAQPLRPALRADGQARLERLQQAGVKALLLVTENDALVSHADRVPPASSLRYEVLADSAEAIDRISEFFFTSAPPVQANGVHLPDVLRRYLKPRTLDLAAEDWLYVSLPEQQPRRLWLHDLGQSHRRGAVADVRLDLPGHGYSTIHWPDDPGAVLTIIRETLAELDLDNLAIAGRGLGQRLAESMAGTTQKALAPPAVPNLEPSWEGAHLLRAWHYTRLRSQYQDWSDPRPEQRVAADMPKPEVLQALTLDLLRAGSTTLGRLGQPR